MHAGARSLASGRQMWLDHACGVQALRCQFQTAIFAIEVAWVEVSLICARYEKQKHLALRLKTAGQQPLSWDGPGLTGCQAQARI